MVNAWRLEVLHDTETIIHPHLHILHNANSRWDYFADTRSLSLIPSTFEVLKKAILEAKARQTVDRHLDGVKGNFGVSDSEYVAISITRSNSLAESKSTGTTISRL